MLNQASRSIPGRRGLNAHMGKPRADRARALTRSGSCSPVEMGNGSPTLARAPSSAQCYPVGSYSAQYQTLVEQGQAGNTHLDGHMSP